MLNHSTTIAKNTIVLSFRMVFVLLLSLYTSRVFLNVLGVIDYGISTVVAGFVSMLSFLNTSFAACTQRFYNSELGREGKSGVTRVYNTSLMIQAIIALSVFILLETMGLWYLFSKMVIPEARFRIAFWLYQFSVVSTLFAIMQSPYSAAIIAYEKMTIYAIVSIIEVLLKFCFSLILPYYSADKLLLLGLFYMFVEIIDFVIYFVFCKIRFKELHLSRNIDKGMFREMISFSGWSLLGTSACVIREQGLNMVLNLFFGPVVNAARAVAYQVSSTLQSFVSNLGIAAKPQMIQTYAAGDSSRTIKMMYTMSKFNFIILFVLSVPMMLNIHYVLNFWLGDYIPEHTAEFIVLIILTSFINNLNSPISNVVYSIGELKNYEITFFVINVLIIPLSCVALHMGAPAETAFGVYFIITILVQIGCLLVLRSMISISLVEYMKVLIFPLAEVALFSFLATWGINLILSEGVVRIILQYIVITLFGGGAFYICALNSSERIILLNTIRRNQK